jgi:signal transduction histidine kinase
VLLRTDGEFSTDDAWFLWELALLAGLGIGSSRLIEMSRSMRELDRIKSRHVAQLLHQIGSPLATIACSLRAVLQTSERLDAEDRGLLESSADRVKLISELSRRLLDLGAIRAGRGLVPMESGPVSAASVLLEEVRARQIDADRSGVKIAVDIRDRNGLILADAEGLRTVFANLLDNAIKYSAGKGKTIHVSQDSDSRRLRVTIRDEGIGIPAEDRPRLFEDFQRGRNALASGVPGFGLGLAFVRELVTRYGGQIDIQSELGRGTSVSVEFPLVPPAPRR